VAESYQYDTRPYGIRTYEERYGVGRSLRYNDEDNLLEAGDTDYQHDMDGFLISKTEGTQVTSYDYSFRGELLSVTLPDSTVIEYVHDPLGRRIAKKVDGTVTEKYLWQGLTRLLAVYNADDTLRMRFEYADARMPVAMTKAGATYYLAYDQIGTLKAVADASGNVIRSIEYDSFGNILSDSDPAFAVPFGFAGGLHDRDTELVRFGYRDYDPETGRWTAKDPIGFAGGDTDLYGYVLNDPINFTDTNGLSFQSAAQSFVEGAVRGAVGAAVVSGVAVGAVSVGVPVAAATAALGAVAAVSAIAIGIDTGVAIRDGNWDQIASIAGSLAGGFAAGGALGRPVAEGINGVKSPPWSMKSDWGQRYKPGLGTVGKWFGTGTNPGSAGLSVGIIGAGVSVDTQFSPCGEQR